MWQHYTAWQKSLAWNYAENQIYLMSSPGHYKHIQSTMVYPSSYTFQIVVSLSLCLLHVWTLAHGQAYTRILIFIMCDINLTLSQAIPPTARYFLAGASQSPMHAELIKVQQHFSWHFCAGIQTYQQDRKDGMTFVISKRALGLKILGKKIVFYILKGCIVLWWHSRLHGRQLFGYLFKTPAVLNSSESTKV